MENQNEKNHGQNAIFSPPGNWTPVSHVTGGDIYHYTIEDELTFFEKFYKSGIV